MQKLFILPSTSDESNVPLCVRSLEVSFQAVTIHCHLMNRPHQNQISDFPHVMKQEKIYNLKFNTVEWAWTNSHYENKVIMTDWLVLFHHLNNHGVESHLFPFICHTQWQRNTVWCQHGCAVCMCVCAFVCCQLILKSHDNDMTLSGWQLSSTALFPITHFLSNMSVISFFIPAHSPSLITHISSLISFFFNLIFYAFIFLFCLVSFYFIPYALSLSINVTHN